jgi:phosphoglycerate kinase
MNFKSIRDFDLKGKRVLLRADLNVPVQNSRVSDTMRIDRLKPTIDELRSAGARILIVSHFGRPEGAQNPEMSLAFLTPVLEQRWNCDVRFAQNCIGPQAEQAVSALADGHVLLLENVRFHKGEEKNDPAFAAQLAALGDIYVNDAFSAAHRAHASTEGLAHLLPSAAGLLMEEELHALDRALGNPQKPVAAITGGSKISTKLKVLHNLVEKTDVLILGGGMANTFLYALGGNTGQSLCEKDMADEARRIAEKAKSRGCEIVLPVDSIAVRELKPGTEGKAVASREIPESLMAVDIGPQSIEMLKKKLRECKTVLWNGPMGVFEITPFDSGTNALAREVAALTLDGKIVSVAGGGDTVAALENAGVAEDFTYISTAGGAFLEWLEGKTLPGVAALCDRHKAA